MQPQRSALNPAKLSDSLLVALGPRQNNFAKIDVEVDTSLLLEQLVSAGHLWNQNPERKLGDGSPHAQMSDIWLRFRPKHELLENKHYDEAHIPAWYPARDLLSEAERICLDMMAHFRCVQLGGVLITKIPPGGKILPHDDRGRWHPEFFNCKVYIPIKSNPGCINICEHDAVNMKVGEVWSFDNLKTHSVENNGDTDRITLIISMRKE